MPSVSILRESAVVKTPRVLQLEGLFDVPPSKTSAERWKVDFELPDDWNIGAIVGPSGSGKTTIASEMFGEYLIDSWTWSDDKSIIDAFPVEMSIKDITLLLSSVGFSSPPSWLRPYKVLSTGEQFRVSMARTLAELPDLSVVDEFTSVVDRTVAQIGSAAIAKTVRRRNQKFIAVSCHYDILDWLEPDWVYQPHTGEYYTGRYLHQRPAIELNVWRVHRKAWAMFRKHHYLNTSINRASQCYVALLDNVPVAFCAVLPLVHPRIKRTKREHRLVCLPDYQGIGIGGAMSEYIGAILKGKGYSYRSVTSHPSFIASRIRSDKWRVYSRNNVGDRMASKSGKLTGKRWRNNTINKRISTGFEYVGTHDVTGRDSVLTS